MKAGKTHKQMLDFTHCLLKLSGNEIEWLAGQPGGDVIFEFHPGRGTDQTRAAPHGYLPRGLQHSKLLV